MTKCSEFNVKVIKYFGNIIDNKHNDIIQVQVVGLNVFTVRWCYVPFIVSVAIDSVTILPFVDASQTEPSE